MTPVYPPDHHNPLLACSFVFFNGNSLRRIPVIIVVNVGTGFYVLAQLFSIGVPQESLKHASPNYLVWGTDLFSVTSFACNQLFPLYEAETTVGLCLTPPQK